SPKPLPRLEKFFGIALDPVGGGPQFVEPRARHRARGTTCRLRPVPTRPASRRDASMDRAWRDALLLDAETPWVSPLRPIVKHEEIVGRIVLTSHSEALGLGPVFGRDRTQPPDLAVWTTLPVPMMELVRPSSVVHRSGQDQEPIRDTGQVPNTE